jgi:hypothetical protein
VAATAAAGVLVTALVMRNKDLEDFNRRGCGTRDLEMLYPPECKSLLDDSRKAETWATAGGAAAGALGVAAAVLFLTLPETDTRVSMQASSSRLGLGLQGRF